MNSIFSKRALIDDVLFFFAFLCEEFYEIFCISTKGKQTFFASFLVDNVSRNLKNSKKWNKIWIWEVHDKDGKERQAQRWSQVLALR